jgi:hypothetical protein
MTEQHLEPSSSRAISTKPEEQRGAAGIALIVWLLGGSLGLALVVFVLLKAC